ncbi:MAG: hypothetical protein ABIJ41_03395 [Candidatus Omnitrophota bacterium]
MSFNDVMMKIRHWDNRAAKWMVRHFYLLFFEVLLGIIFVIFFVISIHAIDVGIDAAKEGIVERLLMLQTFGLSVLILLMLMNSFWMLYIFNSILRIRTLLKELNFHFSRRHPRG